MTNKDKSFWQKNWLTIAIVTILMVVAIAMCFLLSADHPTPRETALESLILAVFSFTASYLVSKILAEINYNQTLRDNGVQIASGIIVLKRQIGNLSDWTARKKIEFKKDEQVTAALDHVQCTLNMFRDLNDAALGGVAGVIGDALAQYETVMKQVSKIRGDVSEETAEIEKEMQMADPSQFKKLETKIQNINESSEKLISQLSRQTPLPIPSGPIKKKFDERCPYCSGPNYFEMIDRPGETRTILCKNCGGRFNAHIAAGLGMFIRKNPKFQRRMDLLTNQIGVLPSAINHPAPAEPDAATPTPASTTATPILASLPKRENPPAVYPKPTENLVGTITFRETLLENKNWISNDRKEESRRLLKETQSFVESGQLKYIAQMILKADQQLRDAGQKRTPQILQSLVLAAPREDGATNSAIRVFVKHILRGHAFAFVGFSASHFFYAEYTNNLDEPSLINAYARGSLKFLCRLRPLSEADSSWLAELLLGGAIENAEETVKQFFQKY